MSDELWLGYEALRGYTDEWDRGEVLHLARKHLIRHAFVCGSTGSGKTVFAKGLVEEVVASGVPVVAIDLKGDLASMALTTDRMDEATLQAVFGADAAEVRREYGAGLRGHRAAQPRAERFAHIVEPRIFTPRSTAGIQLALPGLPSFDAPPTDEDEREARRQVVERLVQAFAQRLYGNERRLKRHEHEVKFLEVLVWQFAERGEPLEGRAGIQRLMHLMDDPPIQTVGGLDRDEFVPPGRRQELKRMLATRITGAEGDAYRGASLSMDRLIGDPAPGRVPLAIVYLAHIDSFDEQSWWVAQIAMRMFTWARRQGGSSDLRALLYLDELGGGEGRTAFFPSYPFNPPSKAPLSFVIKQGRSSGLGALLATQNPMSVDLRALANVHTWGIGHLTQHNDHKRIKSVLEDLEWRPRRVKKDLATLDPGYFLTVSAGLDRGRWIRERWLYGIHRQLAKEQVRALWSRMQQEPAAASEGAVRDEPAPPPPEAPEPRGRSGPAAPQSPGDERPPLTEETIDLNAVDEADHTAETLMLGSSGWLLLGLEEPIPIEPDTTLVIGRSRSADVTLDDRYVSGRHVELRCDARGTLSVRNLKAKNPAALDGKTFTTETKVTEREEAELKLGKTTLRLVRSS